jgi:threonyl-tRNA synthetase
VSDADEYANGLVEQLRAAGIRAEADLRNEKINYKVREHSLAKVPVLLVVGRREAEEGTVAVRRLGSERQQVAAFGDVLEGLRGEALAPDLRRG